ncbi:MAG: hypothetical protein QOK27_107 [Gemmatimonadales bacterium]|nr:hypothetical protein [Gemmatimonadales bacterium]
MTTATLQRSVPTPDLTTGALRCRRKFLRLFPDGFDDPEYVELERDYKWRAHEAWTAALGPKRFRALLGAGKYAEIASRAVSIESRTNLLFSFEKMALRDAIRSAAGARAFSQGLYDFLHGQGTTEARFSRWIEAVAGLPRRQTRVLTWPLLTVFGFIAVPAEHFFLKPRVTQAAAREYGYDFQYVSRPNWATYADLLSFARRLRRDLQDLGPRDMIDVQSFLWIQGSEEYEE